MSWINTVIDFMQVRLKQFPDLYKLASNKTIVESMYREYLALLARGYKAADIVSGSGDFVKWNQQTYEMSRKISNTINVNNLLVLNFFLALYSLSAIGKIPYEKWNPKGFQVSEQLKKTFPSEQGIITKAKKEIQKTVNIFIPLAIAAGAIYIMSTKRGK